MDTYKELRINGSVTIERVETVPSTSFRVLLMGMTGVGKSAFVECLSGKSSLGISKNQLEGVTQEVVAYRLVNVTDGDGDPIYIIDSPGFSDRKISEMKIVKMIQEWMKNAGLSVVSRVVLFGRITDIRMSGSKGRALSMFKALTGEKGAKRVIIATTMWDQLWREDQVSKAMLRYVQLQDEHWMDILSEGAQLVKFQNTQLSAMRILDQCLSNWGPRVGWFNFEDMPLNNRTFRQTAFALPLYQNLLERNEALNQKLRFLESDMAQEATQQNEELMEILTQDILDTEMTLHGIEQELLEFGPPPGPVVDPLALELQERPRTPPSSAAPVIVRDDTEERLSTEASATFERKGRTFSRARNWMKQKLVYIFKLKPGHPSS